MKKLTCLIGAIFTIFYATIVHAAPPMQTPEGQAYVVQADDWLSKLADKYLGNALAYEQIVESTNSKAAEDDSFVIISNPNIIEVGQKIWLPTLDAENDPNDEIPIVETDSTEDATSDTTTTEIEPVADTAQTQETAAPQNQDTSTTTHPAEALIASFTEPSRTNGDLLILYGQIVDVNGDPIPDAVIEIWQTDMTGVYNHPQDPGTNNRDTTFQFFGKAAVNEAGWYVFRTITPGRYEPRPRHIHYKVKQNNRTLLTSQFYFSDDITEVQDEGMFQAIGDSGNLLLLQLVQGEGQLLANGQIVVRTGLGAGTLPLTPSQAEGPYYPVVSLTDYDNDLTILPQN